MLRRAVYIGGQNQGVRNIPDSSARRSCKPTMDRSHKAPPRRTARLKKTRKEKFDSAVGIFRRLASSFKNARSDRNGQQAVLCRHTAALLRRMRPAPGINPSVTASYTEGHLRLVHGLGESRSPQAAAAVSKHASACRAATEGSA